MAVEAERGHREARKPGAPAGFSAAASAGGETTERLRCAKEMLGASLITDTEYESNKARVVDAR